MSRRLCRPGTIHRWALAAVALCVLVLVLGLAGAEGPGREARAPGVPAAETAVVAAPVAETAPYLRQLPPDAHLPVNTPDSVPKHRGAASGRQLSPSAAAGGVRGEPVPPRSAGFHVVRVPRAPPAGRR